MRGTTQSRTGLTGLLVFVLAMAAVARAEGQRLMPQIEGEWWTVAGDPDLGNLTSPKQQPVDFASGRRQHARCDVRGRCRSYRP